MTGFADSLVNKWARTPSPSMIGELQQAYTQAVERALASTVSVSASGRPSFRHRGPSPTKGVGSGVVLDGEGHILTNYHVVGGVEKAIVTLADGRVFGGRVVGGDEETDVAVVQVEEADLRPAEFGDSEALRAGQPVLAIGNPLGLSGGPTVTSGVVSSLQRNLRLGNGSGVKVIQTDAPVNPGNSGGPLVDLEGKVVAVTTAMMPYAQGIGFAIPINAAREIAQQILAHGGVQRPWLGIVGYDVNRRLAIRYQLATGRGVFVVELTPGGPAETAGLRVGDVILTAGGEATDGVGDLVDILRTREIGQRLELEVERHGERSRTEAVLGTRPF